MKESEARFRGWLLRETGIDPDSLGNDFLTRALTDRVHTLQADGERLLSAGAAGWRVGSAGRGGAELLALEAWTCDRPFYCYSARQARAQCV